MLSLTVPDTMPPQRLMNRRAVWDEA